jgi:geranylgeranyl reductase family protein
MMRVGIIGAGPAGAHLAYLLSRGGSDVLLFDAREAWEKPCGGGVTSKALREFAFLQRGTAARQLVSSVQVISARGHEVAIQPKHDFAIYARAELSRMMRRRATDAGAQLHCSRVERLARAAGQWEIVTARGEQFTCDFLVAADGATSTTRRRLGAQFAPSDFAYALGWHVRPSNPGQTRPASARVAIKYLDQFSGYLWAFPRTDHISYGIVTKYGEATPQVLKARLLDFIAARDAPAAREIESSRRQETPRASFYAAMIPALEAASWDRLQACNAEQAWALVGDAAGFADPITGEGIYYALKSAELLAQSLLTRAQDYDEMWRAEFGAEMRRAAQMLRRFYRGHFAGAAVTERMVQVARLHRGVRETLRDLIAGEQGYIDLKRRLLRDTLAVI